MQPASRDGHDRAEHVSPEILAAAAPVQSSLQQTFEGRSHTEIARLIAKDHGWLIFGDMLLATDGLVIADSLEAAMKPSSCWPDSASRTLFCGNTD